MRILILTNRIPYPLNEGGNLAVYELMKGFINHGATVSMLSMNTTKHWVDISKLPAIYSKLQSFDTIKIDNRVKAWGAFKNLILGKSYHVQRFISPLVKGKLKYLLEKYSFDIIHLEGLFVTPYIDFIRLNTRAKIVYRQHNIEHNIWRNVADNESNIFKKSYVQLLAKQLRKFELAQFQKVDAVLPISTSELEENILLGCKKLQHLVPFGIDNADIKDCDDTIYTNVANRHKIYHIGAMDWYPNQEGLDWFLSKVWPIIIEKIPTASFHFAGRKMSNHYLSLNMEKVNCFGEVKDADLFEADKGILIVPLKSASGIRIKLLKAMAKGKAIVSTSIGAKGLALSPGENIIIADTPESFADGIIRIIQSENTYESLSRSGLSLIKSTYTNESINTGLMDFYNKLITH